MDRKIIIEGLENALDRFEDAMKVEATDDLIRAGCIQYFEFCFELAWKSVRVFCEEQGQDNCNSPKRCLKQAFANSWIENEELWLNMLSARNRMSHTYSAGSALSVYSSLHLYLPELQKLLRELQNELET